MYYVQDPDGIINTDAYPRKVMWLWPDRPKDQSGFCLLHVTLKARRQWSSWLQKKKKEQKERKQITKQQENNACDWRVLQCTELTFKHEVSRDILNCMNSGSRLPCHVLSMNYSQPKQQQKSWLYVSQGVETKGKEVINVANDVEITKGQAWESGGKGRVKPAAGGGRRGNAL